MPLYMNVWAAKTRQDLSSTKVSGENLNKSVQKIIIITTIFIRHGSTGGMAMGNPLFTGPVYNKDGRIMFANNRINAHHLGISGTPGKEWAYRLLLTYPETGERTTIRLMM